MKVAVSHVVSAQIMRMLITELITFHHLTGDL